MRIPAGSKLVFIGDSVTDCGRNHPVGEGLGAALGNGYVSYVDALLQSTAAGERIRVVNMGTSGQTVRDLRERWQRDVLDLRPDWLVVMIGINDVWRQFDSYLRPNQGVPLGEYERVLGELIGESKALVAGGIVLMTPFYIESLTQDAMRARMDEYGQAVHRVATAFDTDFVDTQAAFNETLQHVHSSAISWDRVHPNTVGHMVLARAFLKAVGFTW